MKTVIIIPARYESSRFPGKPLIDILGKSMIVRTWERCTQALDAKLIYVATDDQRIAEHCEDHGIQVVMTSADCITGTDRVQQASEQISADIYLDVQGDEPVIDPEDIRIVINAATRRPDAVINGMCDITDEKEYRSPMVPKVIAAPDGRLLYMSRAPVPSNKSDTFAGAKRQVCIMSFSKHALDVFVSVVAKTPVEKIEDLEVLRFLELGIPVYMVNCSDTSIPIDRPEDVSRVEARLRELG
jgi:3-deoxy-manno-octulosonate cytidylyltransferase (CMP-KDO synthetase)